MLSLQRNAEFYSYIWIISTEYEIIKIIFNYIYLNKPKNTHYD